MDLEGFCGLHGNPLQKNCRVCLALLIIYMLHSYSYVTRKCYGIGQAKASSTQVFLYYGTSLSSYVCALHVLYLHCIRRIITLGECRTTFYSGAASPCHFLRPAALAWRMHHPSPIYYNTYVSCTHERSARA